MSQGRGDFNAVCLSILKKVEDQLGQSLSIFNAPVDVKIYPEYSKYVDKPMDLGTIRGRLEKRIYRDAQEFCNVSALTVPSCRVQAQDRPLRVQAGRQHCCRQLVMKDCWRHRISAPRSCCATQDTRQDWDDCFKFVFIPTRCTTDSALRAPVMSCRT